MRIKELFSARDMTDGAPWKRIAEFSLPMLLGNFAQQLYNTADSVIVGEFVGDNALAAVGSAGPILNLLLAIFVGVSTGAGIVVSQSFGARDRQGLSMNIGNCICLAAIATVIIMIVGPMVTPMWISIISTIILRVPTAYFLAHLTKSELNPNGHPLALFTSLLVSWSLGMVMSIIVFRIGRWKKKMLQHA